MKVGTKESEPELTMDQGKGMSLIEGPEQKYQRFHRAHSPLVSSVEVWLLSSCCDCSKVMKAG